MASEKQIHANRANSRLSTGPKTDEGKAASRRNAMQHGLRATACVGEEMRGEVEGKVADYLRTLRPEDAVERTYVDHAAFAAVRVRHAFAAIQARLERGQRDALRTWDARRAARVRRLAKEWKGRPAEPLVKLQGFAEGCDWLWDQWDALREALAEKRQLAGVDAERALLLVGQADVPTPRSTPLAVALGQLVYSAREQPALAALGQCFGARSDAAAAFLVPPEQARAELAAFIDEEMARLREKADMLWEAYDAPDRAGAPDRALHATDPELERLRRYEQMGCRLHRSMVEGFHKHRRDSARERDAAAPSGSRRTLEASAHEFLVTRDAGAPNGANSDRPADPPVAAMAPFRASEGPIAYRVALADTVADAGTAGAPNEANSVAPMDSETDVASPARVMPTAFTTPRFPIPPG